MAIENAKIIDAELSMEDHGCLVLFLTLKGRTWTVLYGGRVIGKGYVGAKEFTGYAKGIEEVMRIMDTVGVSKFTDMVGKYVRVDLGSWGDSVTKIGNIIEDKWFDYKEFYRADS